MKTAVALCAAIFGAWFWQRLAQSGGGGRWPDGMPMFASGQVECSYRLKTGTSFVSITVPVRRAEALARAREAFVSAGWREAPMRARDTLIFVRGDSMAAVLAEETDAGTRMTAVARAAGGLASI